MLGAIEVDDSTRAGLIAHSAQRGDVHLGGDSATEGEERITDLLRLIASTREYQLA